MERFRKLLENPRKYAKEWKAGTAGKTTCSILTLHRAGVGCVFGVRETAVEMRELGIPFLHYETSHPGNRTDLDENRMLDQLDTFMETQETGGIGLRFGI